MAMIRKRGEKFELRVKHSSLPNKIFTATFTDEVSARNYGTQLEALLARGMLPYELAAPRAGSKESETLVKIMREYEMAVSISPLDREVLGLLRPDIGSVRIDNVLKYRWCEEWVRSLKLDKNLAPGTIRKRVGALARMLDWYLRKDFEQGIQLAANPLRSLPKNYSRYNPLETQHLEDQGKQAKRDQSRDRRLFEGEEERIKSALRGERRPDRERPFELPEREALLDLFQLLLNTGLRLREAYTLRVQDVKLDLRTLHVRRSKTGVARDIPILPELFEMLKRRRAAAAPHGPAAAIFPWWKRTTDAEELNACPATIRNSGVLPQWEMLLRAKLSHYWR